MRGRRGEVQLGGDFVIGLRWSSGIDQKDSPGLATTTTRILVLRCNRVTRFPLNFERHEICEIFHKVIS